MMKKFFAILLAMLLLCGCALAENPHDLWLGGMLKAELPEEAEMVGNTESEQGYLAQFIYQDAYILHGRFKNPELRQRYINMVFPASDAVQEMDAEMIAGCEAAHMRWTTGENEDTDSVEAYLFETEEDTFLFLVCVDAEAYAGFMDVDAAYYPDLIAQWAQGLQIVNP